MFWLKYITRKYIKYKICSSKKLSQNRCQVIITQIKKHNFASTPEFSLRTSQNYCFSLYSKDNSDLNFNTVVLYFLFVFAFDIFKLLIVENVKHTNAERIVCWTLMFHHSTLTIINSWLMLFHIILPILPLPWIILKEIVDIMSSHP